MSRCKHLYLQIEEFTALGAVVSCTECKATFHQAEDISANQYLPFIHNIAGKGEREISFLIHHSMVKTPDA